jgi:PAS domain S-box-containing protein
MDFQHAQEVGQMGSWRMNVRLNELTWSDESYRIFGIPKDTLLTYETFLETVHPDDRDFVDAKWKAGLAGEPYDIEHRIVVDGKVKCVREKAYLEFDEAGELKGGFGITQDITKRKLSEQALQEAHDKLEQRVEERTAELAQTVEQLREEVAERIEAERHVREQAELLDLAHDAIFVHDMDGRISYWNRGAERTYGWSKDEALGRDTHALLQTEFPQPLAAMLDDVVGAGSWEGEVTHRTRDGRTVYMASRWVLIREADGTPKAVLKIDRDITAQKQAEAKAAAERQRLYTVMNLFPGYVVLTNRDYNIRFASHGFLDLFGPAEDRPCYTVQYGLDEPCEDCPMSRIIDQGLTDEWEWTHEKGRTFHLWAFPFEGDEGETLMLQLGVDITDRRELEQEVSRISEGERRRVGRDLHDSLGQKLTGMGFLVRSLTEKLRQAGDDPDNTADLLVENIGEAVAEVRSLAHGLDPVGLEGHGLIEALTDLTDEMASASEMECSLNLDDTVDLPVETAANLYYIAQEALNNAVKHSRASKIMVSLESRDNDVVLTIYDNGVGIDTQRPQAGMGMRVMQHRANAANGQLRVTAADDGGTVVRCTIPFE